MSSSLPQRTRLPRPRAVVGREAELAQIHALLSGDERLAGLSGPSGIGKTALAAAYALAYAHHYPGGVYWVDAPSGLADELAALAEGLGLVVEAPHADRRRALILALAGFLNEHPNALLVIDDLEDPRLLRTPALGFVPLELPCRLLFTTQSDMSDLHLPFVEVRALPEDAALALLAAARPEDAIDDVPARDVRRRLVRALGGQPLALSLAAAWLARHPEAGIDELSRRLGEAGLGALGAGDGEVGEDHAAALRASLQIAWEAAARGDALDVLHVAALFGDGGGVPRARLHLLSGHDGEARVGAALEALEGLGLLSETLAGRVHVTSPVRAFVATTLEDPGATARAARERLTDALWAPSLLHEEAASRGVRAVLEDLRAAHARAGEDDRLAALRATLDLESAALSSWDPRREPSFFLQQVRERAAELGHVKLAESAATVLGMRGDPYLASRVRTTRPSEVLCRTLEGHTAKVNAVAVTPDGRTALSASDDGTTRVWDLETGTALRVLSAHEGGVRGVAVTPDGRVAVTAAMDETLIVWDVPTGRAVRFLRGHNDVVHDVALTPDGKRSVSASEDRTLRVWDLGAGRLLRTLWGHESGVQGVAVTDGGRLALSASWDETAVRVWDLEGDDPPSKLAEPSAAVSAVAVTPDGRVAVGASFDEAVLVWDLQQGGEARALLGHADSVTSVAITPDGRLAASGSWDHTVKIWDLERMRELSLPLGHKERVSAVAITPDGRRVVSASFDDTLCVWDVASGAPERALEGHTLWVYGVAITDDGRHAVSASLDGTVKVWEIATGRLVRDLDRLAGFGPGVHVPGGDGLPACAPLLLAAGGLVLSVADDGALAAWDLQTGARVRSFQGHAGYVTGAAKGVDGRLVTAAIDGTLGVWELATGRRLHALVGHDAPVRGLSTTPDGRLAVSASEDGTLRVWDIISGALVRTLVGHRGAALCVSLGGDGRLVVSGAEDRTVRVWDIGSGAPVSRMALRVPVDACAASPDGCWLVAGDRTGGMHFVTIAGAR